MASIRLKSSAAIARAGKLLARFEEINKTLDGLSSPKGFKKAIKPPSWNCSTKAISDIRYEIPGLQESVSKSLSELQWFAEETDGRKKVAVAKIVQLPKWEDANDGEQSELGKLEKQRLTCKNEAEELSNLQEDLSEGIKNTAARTTEVFEKFLNYGAENGLPFNYTPPPAKRDPFPSNVVGFFGNAMTFVAKKVTQFTWNHPVITLGAAAAFYTYWGETSVLKESIVSQFRSSIQFLSEQDPLEQIRPVLGEACGLLDEEDAFGSPIPACSNPALPNSLSTPAFAVARTIFSNPVVSKTASVAAGLKVSAWAGLKGFLSSVQQKGIAKTVIDHPGRTGLVLTSLSFAAGSLIGAGPLAALTTATAVVGFYDGASNKKTTQPEPVPLT